MKKIQTIPLERIDGSTTSLGEYADKVVLVVNVASQCGLTRQYGPLGEIYETYKDKGLVVAGFPANDFGGQEPGSNEEIATFCETSFSVQFPMFAKVVATGPDKHPFFAELIERAPAAQGDIAAMRAKMIAHNNPPNPEPEILWNFEKFLISRDGDVVARFGPGVSPTDPLIIDAIEAAL